MNFTLRAATVLLALIICLLAGCGNRQSTAQKAPAPQEEMTITSMGSWIPRKVRTKQDIIADGTGVTDGELLERARRAAQPARLRGGSK